MKSNAMSDNRYLYGTCRSIKLAAGLFSLLLVSLASASPVQNLSLWKGLALSAKTQSGKSGTFSVGSPSGKSPDRHGIQAELDFSPPVEFKVLPLSWLLDRDKDSSPLGHLLAGLVRCEAHANRDGDVWFAEDCRQTWIALYKTFVTKEFATYRQAEIDTSYRMYGCHIDELGARIAARRQALLGQPVSISTKKKRAPVSSKSDRERKGGAA